MSKSNSSRSPRHGGASSGTRIYMDYASSALPNPSSIHGLGVEAKKKLENARKEVALILSARTEEVVFTSGGTESNNLAILGIVRNLPQVGLVGTHKSDLWPKPHIVTTNIEHSSVLEVCKYLEKEKFAEVTYVPVEQNGIVDPKKIKKALRPNTVLVSVMYANNEIGTIQPLRAIAREIRHHKKIHPTLRPPLIKGRVGEGSFPLFHTDAVQAVNYLDLNIEKLGVDLLTLSGSKIQNSGRVGILYKKNKVNLSPIMYGGDQEQGLRPGTENLEAILKFTKAFKEVRKIKDQEVKRLIKLRDYFIKKMSKTVFDIRLNGGLENRLPNNLNITIPNIPSDLLVVELSARGIMVSSKSACKSGDGKASHVIEAIYNYGRNSSVVNSEINGSLRFSMGHDTTKVHIDYTIKSLSQILKKLKKWYN